MKVSDIAPSKYMKAHVDVPEDGTVTATITNVTQEKGQGDDGADYTMNLLHLKEHDKPLKLNKGMLGVLEALYGDETDEWRGKRVILFCTVQGFGGKDYNVIRIKAKNPDMVKTVVKAAATTDKAGDPPF
jgi:hypothetical protein